MKVKMIGMMVVVFERTSCVDVLSNTTTYQTILEVTLVLIVSIVFLVLLRYPVFSNYPML